MPPKRINHAAVWLTIVLAQILMYAWFEIFTRSEFYVPPEYGSPEMEGKTFLLYVIGFLATMVAMYVLGAMFNRLQLESASEGAVIGLVIGLVFNIFSLITIYTMSEHPLEIGLIDFGLNILIFFMVGIVHGAFAKRSQQAAA